MARARENFEKAHAVTPTRSTSIYPRSDPSRTETPPQSLRNTSSGPFHAPRRNLLYPQRTLI